MRLDMHLPLHLLLLFKHAKESGSKFVRKKSVSLPRGHLPGFLMDPEPRRIIH